MTKFSLLMPVHNGAKYLSEAIDSMVNQTYSDIEIIIADDASIDDTASIINKYAQNDKRIIPISVSSNIGTAAVRKLLISRASCESSIFIDADDELLPNACEVLSAVEQEIDADIIQFDESVINSSELSQDVMDWFVNYIRPYAGRLDGDDLLNKCFRDRLFAWNLHGKLLKTELLRRAYDPLAVECTHDSIQKFRKPSCLFDAYLTAYSSALFALLFLRTLPTG